MLVRAPDVKTRDLSQAGVNRCEQYLAIEGKLYQANTKKTTGNLGNEGIKFPTDLSTRAISEPTMLRIVTPG